MKTKVFLLVLTLALGLAAAACAPPKPDLGQRFAQAAGSGPLEIKLNVLDSSLNRDLEVEDVRFTDQAGIVGLQIQWRNLSRSALTFSTQARWFAAGLFQESAAAGWIPVQVLPGDMAITTLTAPKAGVDRLDITVKLERREP